MSTHLSETSTDPILPVEARVIRTNMVIKKSLSMLSHSTGHQPSLAEDIGTPITDFLGWKQLKKVASSEYVTNKKGNHIFQNAGVTANKLIRMKRSHFLDQFFIAFCVAGSFLF